MTNPDDKLARLWAKDEAPEVDPAFAQAVSARIGRRQILHEVGEVMAWAAPAAAVTWAVWPSVAPAAQPLMEGVIQVGPVLVIVAATLFALWSAARLLHMPGFDLGELEYFLPRGRFHRANKRFD
jgi:hypothetical protein